ncbi:uncharacterized protein LOC109364357, partial [Meleagris gallopavo]|uniref:uncharacterized protein LOC109364357 n=1 Tax=Meleagris gallopavo TaxID=9103 RepID=UPI0009388D29
PVRSQLCPFPILPRTQLRTTRPWLGWSLRSGGTPPFTQQLSGRSAAQHRSSTDVGFRPHSAPQATKFGAVSPGIPILPCQQCFHSTQPNVGQPSGPTHSSHTADLHPPQGQLSGLRIPAVFSYPALLFQAIRAINGGDHETSAEEFTNRVFNKIDVNGDGELSLDEFVEGARKDDEFMEVMMKSLDLSHIVAMINNRRHSV